MMELFQGKSVSDGIVIGPAVVWKKNNFIVKKKQILNSEAELARVEEALDLSKVQLKELRAKVAEKESAIFDAYIVLLEDESFLGEIRDLIRRENIDAEYAVWQVSEKIADRFANVEDAYMRERVADIRDVAERMRHNLSGQEDVAPVLTEPCIILAEDLSPSETMQFDRDKVLAFVTAKGSVNSHAAILARSMGIPALVGVEVETLIGCHNQEQMWSGGSCTEKDAVSIFAIVDAVEGQLILNPDAQTIEGYNIKMQQEQERKALLQAYKNQESVTLDGHKIQICANVGSAAEVQGALENGAEGIGLFRSEFLYLSRDVFPAEEEQFQEYKRAAITMGNKQVVIRTLDMGADKQADYFELEQETNPALGYRGIRICLKEQALFKVQLRALLRAAVYGNLAVMYPMITSMEEVEQIQKLVEQAAKELEQEKIPYRIPAQGIMVETPAAVMISDELAEMVDFFSIGTNDLTQYTLAMDRQNRQLDDFYNSRHKAILRMIQMVVDNAHRAGKWVGICGELATDITLTKEFVRMGVDELSVVPGKVLELRKIVRNMKVSQ